jgi:NAD(P)-dependent dehydrogenase (short-subunit alcohol dehydrogenase family)
LLSNGSPEQERLAVPSARSEENMAADDRSTRRIAWIAGVGAQDGLGAAVARRFAAGGLLAVVTGRTAERLESVVKDIEAAGGRALALTADLSREAEVEAAGFKVAALGRLEVAVFNAGSAPVAPSLELSAQAVEQGLRDCALGGFLFGREVLRAFLPQGRGTLLITGATSSLRGRPLRAALAMGKGALRALSQTFAREFGPRGIHVAHVVVDAYIDSERLRERDTQRVAAAGPDGLCSPEDLAEVYWQLHEQPRSAWTQELDLRPYNQEF